MFPKSATLLTFATALALVGCSRPPEAAPDKSNAGADSAQYAAPPAITEVRATSGGVTVAGTAPAGLQVRLATPQGQAVFAQADPRGLWSLVLPPAAETRIFGLSEKADGRQVQAQGYLVVAADGRAALLRAGAGALRLDPRPPPALGAVDFDRDGTTVVSGTAAPDSLVFLRLDGRQIAEARTNPRGRYSLALPQPLPKGAHAIEVAGDAFTNTAEVEVAPPTALAEGPMRSQLSRGGLRIDWMTPGGGVQSTVLLD